MTNTPINHEKYIIPGTYGDKAVYLYHCIPEHVNGIDVVLLHGVHSSANLSVRNKFRNLAVLLMKKGFTPWLVETSRNVRLRYEGEDVPEWVRRAFWGKTFAQEQEDVFRAIKEVLAKITAKAIWLWGFSLGGIIAASTTGQLALTDNSDPTVEKLILSGTGLHAYPEIEQHMIKMPILSTLRETLSADMLSLVRVKEAVSFRGEFKVFFAIKGADHSLRLRNGKADCSILQEMVEYIV